MTIAAMKSAAAGNRVSAQQQTSADQRTDGRNE
jgi:hypothetical protein